VCPAGCGDGAATDSHRSAVTALAAGGAGGRMLLPTHAQRDRPSHAATSETRSCGEERDPPARTAWVRHRRRPRPSSRARRRRGRDDGRVSTQASAATAPPPTPAAQPSLLARARSVAGYLNLAAALIALAAVLVLHFSGSPALGRAVAVGFVVIVI